MNMKMDFPRRAAISRLFAFDPSIKTFLFDSPGLISLRDRPQILLDDSWELSTEKRILVGAALDIWNGAGNVFLWELLNELSDDALDCLVDAMRVYRVLDGRERPTENAGAER